MSNACQNALWEKDSIAQLKKMLHLEELVLLRQVHSAEGVSVSDASLSDLLSVKQEGDYLITQLPNTGLGIYTADCLPIIFYDTYNRAVGICHAGWMGSVASVAVATLKLMEETYGTDHDHLRIFFGPSAKVCCYKVTEEFREKIEPEYQEKVLIPHFDELYFDLPLYNRLKLKAHGVRPAAFHDQYNICTICHESFCSNRRNRESLQRQLTVVALK
jgi:YfiH family protein